VLVQKPHAVSDAGDTLFLITIRDQEFSNGPSRLPLVVHFSAW
jgi:hypothetical protein